MEAVRIRDEEPINENAAFPEPPRIDKLAYLRSESSLTHSKDTMPPARDRTTMPNWLMTAIVLAFFALLGFVYTTMQKELDRLDARVSTQESWMKNTREQLIAHGWTVDDQGNIRPPPTKK